MREYCASLVFGNVRAGHALGAVAAGDEIAGKLPLLAILSEADRGLVGIDAVQADVANAEQDLSPGLDPRLDQILDDFVLGIDGDRFAAGQVAEVDAMPLPTEAQLDAGMDEAFALHPLAHTNLGQEIDGPLFENTGADGGFDLFARACFQNDGRDAFKMQKMRQQQTCRSGSDDADLGAHHRFLHDVFAYNRAAARCVSGYPGKLASG